MKVNPLDLLYKSGSDKIRRKILRARKVLRYLDEEDEDIKHLLIEKLDEIHYEMDNKLFEKYKGSE